MRGFVKAAVVFAALLCAFVFADGDDADGDNAPKPDFSLAKTYSPHDDAASLNEYWASEKYDGVRALWDGKRLISRGGKVFAAPDWFVEGMPNVKMDGELWLGRERFEETTSIVRRKTPHEGWRKIRYMVFDLPAHGGVFRERYAAMRAYFDKTTNTYWRVVKQHPVTSAAQLEEMFGEVINGGGEGIMLRRIESLHNAGRSDDLLKHKPFTDAEAVVIGHNPGKGKYAGMTGSLKARALDTGKVFNVGSGLSDQQRQTPPPKGATITFKFQGLTKNGIPRFPVFLRIRKDEPE